MKIRLLVAMAVMLIALSASAATITWAGTTGDYGTSPNWSPAQVPTSADDAYFQNGGTATISGGALGAGRIYLGQASGASGNIAMSGGTLTLSGSPSFVVANGSGSTGSVTMTGTSVLNASSGNVQIGSRGIGLLDVGNAAFGSSAVLYIGAAASGQGTVNLAGTWNATRVLLANNAAASGRLNLNGGHLTVSQDFNMSFVGSSPRLTVNGSAGSFSADSFSATSGVQIVDFIADAGGVTTLNAVGAITLAAGTLNINLDAYTGGLMNLILMDGASLSGTFAVTNFTGNRKGVLTYDTENGRLLVLPEPSRRIKLVVISSK